jgi:hypothetical protein
VKRLKKLEIYEASPVMLGAGIGVQTDVVKSEIGPAEHKSVEQLLEGYDPEYMKAWEAAHTCYPRAELVTPWYEQRTHKAAELAAQDLGIETPTVKFFQEETQQQRQKRITEGFPPHKDFLYADPGVSGVAIAREGTIWIKFDPYRTTEALIAPLEFVVGHEVRHLWQAAKGAESTEEDANWYGDYFRKKFYFVKRKRRTA